MSCRCRGWWTKMPGMAGRRRGGVPALLAARIGLEGAARRVAERLCLTFCACSRRTFRVVHVPSWSPHAAAAGAASAHRPAPSQPCAAAFCSVHGAYSPRAPCSGRTRRPALLQLKVKPRRGRCASIEVSVGKQVCLPGLLFGSESIFSRPQLTSFRLDPPTKHQRRLANGVHGGPALGSRAEPRFGATALCARIGVCGRARLLGRPDHGTGARAGAVPGAYPQARATDRCGEAPG